MEIFQFLFVPFCVTNGKACGMVQTMKFIEFCRANQVEYLLEEWSERNGDADREDFGAASHKKVWWKCAQGHEWQTAIKNRTFGKTDCPYCSGKKVLAGFNDLCTTHPQIVTEWNFQRNGNLAPQDVVAGSEKKVWWKCALGHEWQASVENRAMKRNACPYCSGKRAWPGFNDLETLYPEIASQWHPVMNRDLSPQKVRPGCGKKVWWMCKEGHLWEARIYSRTSRKRPGCPVCAGNAKKVRAGTLCGNGGEGTGSSR